MSRKSKLVEVVRAAPVHLVLTVLEEREGLTSKNLCQTESTLFMGLFGGSLTRAGVNC